MTPTNSNKIVTATLIKRATSDGLVEFNDDVPLGKVYRIDLTLIQLKPMYHLDKLVAHEKEMVWDVKGGWLPTECLSWEGKDGL